MRWMVLCFVLFLPEGRRDNMYNLTSDTFMKTENVQFHLICWQEFLLKEVFNKTLHRILCAAPAVHVGWKLDGVTFIVGCDRLGCHFLISIEWYSSGVPLECQNFFYSIQVHVLFNETLFWNDRNNCWKTVHWLPLNMTDGYEVFTVTNGVGLIDRRGDIQGVRNCHKKIWWFISCSWPVC